MLLGSAVVKKSSCGEKSASRLFWRTDFHLIEWAALKQQQQRKEGGLWRLFLLCHCKWSCQMLWLILYIKQITSVLKHFSFAQSLHCFFLLKSKNNKWSLNPKTTFKVVSLLPAKISSIFVSCRWMIHSFGCACCYPLFVFCNVSGSVGRSLGCG